MRGTHASSTANTRVHLDGTSRTHVETAGIAPVDHQRAALRQEGTTAMTNAETSTSTTDEAQTAMVFKNTVGEYYMVPLETLPQWRVSEERTAEVERLITEQQEVQGYLLPVVVGLISLAGGGLMLYGGAKILEGGSGSGGGGTKELIDAFHKGAGQGSGGKGPQRG
jgi:hypothetical protein